MLCKISVGAIALATLAGPPASAESVLDNARMSAIAAAAANYEPKDSFTPRPDESPTAGQRFRISIPFKEGEGGPIYRLKSGWTYDIDRHSLHVAVPPGIEFTNQYDGIGNLPSRGFRTLTFESRSTDLGSQTGQTVMGVQFQFNSYRGTLFEIGELTPPNWPDLFPADTDASLSKDISMAPDDARRAIQDAVVVVEGRTVAFASGRVTVCRMTGHGATLDLPMQTVIKNCLINVAIDRVAIESPAGGVLAEWRIALTK